VVLALVAALSFVISLAATFVIPAVAFFSLPTRAWQLAVGGLVALTTTQWHRLPPRAAAIVGWARRDLSADVGWSLKPLIAAADARASDRDARVPV
jgi:hypothetical protein